MSCKDYEAVIDQEVVKTMKTRLVKGVKKSGREDPEEDNLDDDAAGDEEWNRNEEENDDLDEE